MDYGKYDSINGASSIPIVYALDDKYVTITLISMVSILKNTDKNVDFLILYSKLSEKSFEIIRFASTFSNCKINFVQIDEGIFKDFQNAKWVTIQAWFRALIPEILKSCDKAIYLDCDTMVRKDISEFYNIDISDVLVGAVTDVWNIKANSVRLNLKSSTYFNSGVLLINCKKWRELNLFDKLKNCATTNSDIKLGDQDVLNYVIDEDKKILSKKFNYLETWWYNYYTEYKDDDAIDYQESKKDPIIVHFTAYKPDNPKSRHSFRHEWWQYAKYTPYYIEMLEKYKTEAEKYIDGVEKKLAEIEKTRKDK